MEAAIAAGAHLINDVSALLHDKRSLEVAGVSGRPVVLMHAPSSGKNPHKSDGYGNIVTDTLDWLEQRIADVVAAGFERRRSLSIRSRFWQIIVGQSRANEQYRDVSRARSAIVDRRQSQADDRRPVQGSTGRQTSWWFHRLCASRDPTGAQIVRVHDVPETVQALQIWRGMRDAGVTAPV